MGARGLLAASVAGITVAIVGTAHACVMAYVYGLGGFIVAMTVTAVAVQCIRIDQNRVNQIIGESRK